METQNRFENIDRQERNPQTHAAHRRQSFWQIIFPMIIGILLVLAAVGAIIFSAVQPVTEVGRWASVSLIWLILPSLIIALLFLAILGGIVFLISMLYRRIPRYALILQMYAEVMKNKVKQVADSIAAPIIKGNGFMAAVRYFFKRDRRLIDKGE